MPVPILSFPVCCTMSYKWNITACELLKLLLVTQHDALEIIQVVGCSNHSFPGFPNNLHALELIRVPVKLSGRNRGFPVSSASATYTPSPVANVSPRVVHLLSSKNSHWRSIITQVPGLHES